MSTISSKRSVAREMDGSDDKALTRGPASGSKNLSVKEHNKEMSDGSDTLSTPVQKNVTFADESDNQEFIPIGHLTEEDCAAMFMSDADQRRIFLDISKTLRSARALQQQDHTHHTNDLDSSPLIMEKEDEGIRGLESIIQQKSNRTKRMRSAVVAVLDRQLTHPIDESWLNGFYRPLVSESKILARKRAVRDEVEASNLGITTTRSSTFISATTKHSHERRGTKRPLAMVQNRRRTRRRQR